MHIFFPSVLHEDFAQANLWDCSLAVQRLSSDEPIVLTWIAISFSPLLNLQISTR
jgi:hypothetical protein